MSEAITLTVRLSAPLSERIGSRGEIAVQATTIRQGLEMVGEQYPIFAQLIWSEDDQISSAILAFLDDTKLNPADIDQVLSTNTQLDLIPAISGG